jgi:hypothetical protein
MNRMHKPAAMISRHCGHKALADYCLQFTLLFIATFPAIVIMQP